MDFPNSIAPNDFKGVIKFENVTFAYPKDKNKKNFKQFNHRV
jgi:ABC-type multidrug transport system fused ATPase/permease subunit